MNAIDWRRQVPPMALAALLFFFAASRGALYNDEANRAVLVSGDYAAMRAAIDADVHPPLFFILLRGWASLWEGADGRASDFALRCFNLPVLLATLFLFQALAAELARSDPRPGRREQPPRRSAWPNAKKVAPPPLPEPVDATLALWLLAASPSFLFFARLANSYLLAASAWLATWLGLLRARRAAVDGKRGALVRWELFAAGAGALLVGASYLGPPLLLSAGVFALWPDAPRDSAFPSRRFWRRALVPAAWGLVALAQVASIVAKTKGIVEQEAPREFSIGLFSLAARFFMPAWTFLGADSLPPWSGQAWFGVAAIGVVAAMGANGARRARFERPTLPLFLGVAALPSFLAASLVFAALRHETHFMFLPERMLWLGPVAAILVAAGLATIRPPERRNVVVGMIALIYVFAWAAFARGEWTNWAYHMAWPRWLSESRAAGWGPKDALLFDNYALGSAGDWYFAPAAGDRTTPTWDRATELPRREAFEALVESLRHSPRGLLFVRPTRDESPGAWSGEMESTLRAAFGEPAWALSFLRDSPDAERLKRLARRFAGRPAAPASDSPGKIQFVYWSASAIAERGGGAADSAEETPSDRADATP